MIPPEHDADFVCAMEDALEVYQRNYDPQRPVVCLDETSKQLVRETRQPVPAAPGHPARIDYEYERNGTANLFLVTEPLVGQRYVTVTERRTAVDFAGVIRDLVDRHYPDAEKIVLVMDNLNTHKPASLYEAFEPAEARRLAERLEIHYTPKHGSWLNVAENELSSLTRQCVSGRRFADISTLREETSAWSTDVNGSQRGVDWQMKIDDARLKLKSVYPTIKP